MDHKASGGEAGEDQAPGIKLGGKYELLELAGEGGMAQVWRAVLRGAAGFSRPVAVKRILPEICELEYVTMFIEEARVCSQLIHPNIVQILDFDTDPGGQYFMVLEWVEGLNLRDYLLSFWDCQQRAPWALAVAIAIEGLRGLSAAHERMDGGGQASPVIHRDVTPGNLLIGENGVVKLTDFGVSRAMDRASWTSPDVVKGKLAYMAPEIFDDQEVSVRSDIFSLGVVLWEALAGHRLYQMEADVEIFIAASEARIPPLNEVRSDLPASLVATVKRALARAPEDRFGSALEMIRALANTLRQVSQLTDDQVLGRSVARARALLDSEQHRPRKATGTLVSQPEDERRPGRPSAADVPTVILNPRKR